MEDLLFVILLYGAFFLFGIPFGRTFKTPWLVFLSVALMAIGMYLIYDPIYGPIVRSSSPESGYLMAMLPYLWFSITGPFLLGAWSYWIASRVL
jgi:hypothetical protein